MEIADLELFQEVMEQGSFSCVARARHATPSHVSRRIAALEASLGFRLFERTTRRLAPTDAGRDYFQRIVPHVEALRAAHLSAAEQLQVPKGRVRVAAPASLAAVELARWLPKLAVRYPELDVELVLDPRISDLIGEQLDVAVRLGRPQAASLVGSKLCDMPRVVTASPEYLARVGTPKKPRDLTRLPCWNFPFEGHDPSWSFRDARGRTETVPVQVRGVAADGFVLRRIALEGGGFTVLPRFLVAEDLRSGRLVDPFPGFDVTPTVFDTAIWLLYPSRDLPLRTRVFVDYAKQQFRDGPPWEKRGDTSAPG